MRFYYYAVILAGIILMLNIAGFQSPSGSLVKTFDMVNSTGGFTLENFKNSALWSNNSATDSIPGLKYILIGAVIAGLVIGAFGKSPDIRYITAGMVFVLTGLILGDIIWLFVLVNSYGVTWITQISALIFGTAAVGLFITAINFWQGND